jgi:hypothetical protein
MARVQPLHPVSAQIAPPGAPVAPVPGAGCNACTPPGQLSTASLPVATGAVHPVRPAVSARPPGHGEPAAQPRELTVKDGDGVGVEVVPDQAEVQVPALRAAVGPFDLGRHDARVARAR